MIRGAPVARILGIPIVVDWSWVIIAVLVTWALFVELAARRGAAGLGAVLLVAVAGALTFFACLLAHELSHSAVAMRRGLKVRRIRLFVFGGVSEIEQEASSPQDELAITAAGPAFSLLLAGAFLIVALVVPSSAGPVDALFELLAVVNLALGIFNLLPGFPLDGGRLLRAFVWRATGDYRRATAVAVGGGRLVAALLAAAGVALLLLGGDPAGLWWMAIGWFLWAAAGASLRRVGVEERLRGLRAEALMAAPPPTVAADQPLGDVTGTGWALVVADGRVRGLLDLDYVGRLGPERRRGWLAEDAMLLVGPADVVDGAAAALDIVGRLDRRAPVVVVRDGRTVGLISRRSLEAWVRRRPDRPGAAA